MRSVIGQHCRSRHEWWSERRHLMAALALLFIIHLAIPLWLDQKTVSYDGRQYLAYARNLVDGRGFTYDGMTPSCGRPPGYPAFLAVFLFLFGDIDLVYPVQLVLLFAAYVVTVWMFKTALGPWRRTAMLAAFVALWPLNRLGITIQSEALFIFLTATGLFALGHFLRKSSRLSLVAFSVLLTFSAYVRPVTALFVLFAAVVLSIGRRIRLRHALVMCFISMILIAPWAIRNWRAFDRLVPMAANYGSIFYMTDETAFRAILFGSATAARQLPVFDEIVGDEFELDLAVNDRYLQRARQNIQRDPFGFLKRCMFKTVFIWTHVPSTRDAALKNPVLFLASVILQGTFLFGVLVGMFRLRFRLPWLVWPGALFAVYHILVLFPFYAESRFLVPIYVALFGFSAFALFDSVDRIRLRQLGRNLG